MTLQINYQPSGMLLGELAQSAGKSEYNKWLAQFNQQKAQSLANAFQSGFVNMGLPIAQMQSRERMVNAQIKARSTQAAQKGLQNVEWWRNNGAMFSQMVGRNLIAKHGPEIVGDPYFADQVANAPKTFTVEQAQKMLADDVEAQTRSGLHRAENSQTKIAARHAGLNADATAANTPNPGYIALKKAFERNLASRNVKPELREKFTKAIDRAVSRYGVPRQPTIKEATEEHVDTVRGGFLQGVTTTTRDPKGKLTQETKYPDRELFDMREKTLTEMAKLVAPAKTADAYGATYETSPEQEELKELLISNYKKSLNWLNKQLEQRGADITGLDPHSDNSDGDMDKASKFDRQKKRWDSLTVSEKAIQMRTKQGFGPSAKTTNREWYQFLKNNGVLEEVMKEHGASDESEIANTVWKELGFSAPPPRPESTLGVKDRQEGAVKREVNGLDLLNRLKQQRTGQPPGPGPGPGPGTGSQLQERMNRIPQFSNEKNAIQVRAALAEKYKGIPPEQWPDDDHAMYLKAVRFSQRLRSGTVELPTKAISP